MQYWSSDVGAAAPRDWRRVNATALLGGWRRLRARLAARGDRQSPGSQGPTPPAVGASTTQNWFDFMVEDSVRVGRKLHESLDEKLLALFLLCGMLPNASARMNAELGPEQNETDHAIFTLNSRITTGCVSTYVLAMRGLITDSTVVLRHVLENVALAIAIMHTPEMGKAWLAGRRYRPGQVRALIKNVVDLKPMYKTLSTYAHPNAAGQDLYKTATPKGYAVTYSGSYQPKNVGLTLLLLAQIEFTYLEGFHRRYAGRLSLDAWPLMFHLAKKLMDDLHAWAMQLPDDWETLREYFSTGTGLMAAPKIDPELQRQAREAIKQVKQG